MMSDPIDEITAQVVRRLRTVSGSKIDSSEVERQILEDHVIAKNDWGTLRTLATIGWDSIKGSWDIGWDYHDDSPFAEVEAMIAVGRGFDDGFQALSADVQEKLALMGLSASVLLQMLKESY